MIFFHLKSIYIWQDFIQIIGFLHLTMLLFFTHARTHARAHRDSNKIQPKDNSVSEDSVWSSGFYVLYCEGFRSAGCCAESITGLDAKVQRCRLTPSSTKSHGGSRPTGGRVHTITPAGCANDAHFPLFFFFQKF